MKFGVTLLDTFASSSADPTRCILVHRGPVSLKISTPGSHIMKQLLEKRQITLDIDSRVYGGGGPIKMEYVNISGNHDILFWTAS